MAETYLFPHGRILVTGCAGFIGAKVVELLAAAGFEVVGIDNLNDYYDVSLKHQRLAGLKRFANFQFHVGDVEDASFLRQLFCENEFAAVINLAARAGVRASVKNPHAYMATNVMGALNLLELMREFKTPKLVQASTSSLYAGQEMPFVESMAVNEPISPYAASKKSAELLAYTYHELYELDVTIVRYFTVYGPAGRPDMSPFRFMNWVAGDQPIRLYGNGQQQRDFTFVDDIARGTIAAMRPLGYEIINLGCGQPHSILELIETIEKLVGKSAMIEALPAHSTDMLGTWAGNEKALELLGWKPTVDFDRGLEMTWQWHREQIAAQEVLAAVTKVA